MEVAMRAGSGIQQPGRSLSSRRLPRSSTHRVSQARLPLRARCASATDGSCSAASATSCDPPPPSRRQLLAATAAAAAAAALSHGPLAAPAWADGLELEAFENSTEDYSLLVPKEWVRSEGTVGSRKLVAFHPEGTTDANVSVLLTPLSPDFTGLGSFGTADAFAEALVNSQDRSYLRKPGQKAMLLDAKSKNGTYYVEYTIQKPGEAKVHLVSSIAVHFNGIYNQLYTLTAQYLEDDAATYASTAKTVVNSFRITG